MSFFLFEIPALEVNENIVKITTLNQQMKAQKPNPSKFLP